ncbi:hypothetical protein [Amycolatopsis anabasis]|uniref:hypothetical protein n=1 Tax=Amycolatopsis anabasis TaxID=1840409 RepID=UPI003CCD87D4
MPEVMTNFWPKAIAQPCVVQLLRKVFCLVFRQNWNAVSGASNMSTAYPIPTPYHLPWMNSTRNGTRSPV